MTVNFDTSIINTHRPNPVTDIHTRDNGDGTYSIIIDNMPFDFQDEFNEWPLQEARTIIAKMSTGNKTYQEMCQVVAKYKQGD